MKLNRSSFPQCSSKFHDSNSLRYKVSNVFLTGESAESQHHIFGALLNQMYSKADIKKHGNNVKEALCEEFMQSHDMYFLYTYQEK